MIGFEKLKFGIEKVKWADGGTAMKCNVVM